MGFGQVSRAAGSYFYHFERGELAVSLYGPRTGQLTVASLLHGQELAASWCARWERGGHVVQPRSVGSSIADVPVLRAARHYVGRVAEMRAAGARLAVSVTAR